MRWFVVVAVLALAACEAEPPAEEAWYPPAPAADGKADLPVFDILHWIHLEGVVSHKTSARFEVVAGADVWLDGRYHTQTDRNGRYLFDKAQVQNVPGLPAGQHVLVVAAQANRARVLRRALATLGTSCGRDCYAANVDLTAVNRYGDNSAIQSIDRTVSSLQQDSDNDQLDDFVEEYVAQKYAPIVYFSNLESNWPINVDWFVPKTALMYYDDGCEPDMDKFVLKNLTAQSQLTGTKYKSNCGEPGDDRWIYSAGTRSREKQKTFYLSDLADKWRGGSSNTQDWRTYVHAFGNFDGGITVQYWRFYAYNDAFNNHGGDWEGVQLILGPDLTPEYVAFLGHSGIEFDSWASVHKKGDHVQVWSEPGGHASHNESWGWDTSRFSTQSWVEDDTWNGGNVYYTTGGVWGASGGLLNVGEKSKPMNGQVFIQYSGLWGSPGLLHGTSGYWGPAFNETGITCPPDNDPYTCSERPYITAWCNRASGFLMNEEVECKPTYQSR